MRRISLILMTAMLFVACKHETLPPNVLDGNRMADFLTEAYMLEGFYAVENNHQYDSIGGEYLAAYDDILQHLDLTREQVAASIEFYMGHPEEYAKINEAVAERLASTSEVGLQK